jgi:hypothetical protein
MIHKAAEDRMEEVRPCIGSLNCLSRLFRDLPYTCTMNPMLGHEVEPEYHVTEATEKKRVMIIGAGPAGMEAAITARRRGHTVTVFDKNDKIGGNLAAYAGNDLARPGRPAKRDRLLRRDGEEARRRSAPQHRGQRQVHAQRAARIRCLHRRAPAPAPTSNPFATCRAANC